jgi:hypothetical protein
MGIIGRHEDHLGPPRTSRANMKQLDLPEATLGGRADRAVCGAVHLSREMSYGQAVKTVTVVKTVTGLRVSVFGKTGSVSYSFGPIPRVFILR